MSNNDAKPNEHLQRIRSLLESPGGSLFAGLLTAASVIGGAFLIIRGLL